MQQVVSIANTVYNIIFAFFVQFSFYWFGLGLVSNYIGLLSMPQLTLGRIQLLYNY